MFILLFKVYDLIFKLLYIQKGFYFCVQRNETPAHAAFQFAVNFTPYIVFVFKEFSHSNRDSEPIVCIKLEVFFHFSSLFQVYLQ